MTKTKVKPGEGKMLGLIGRSLEQGLRGIKMIVPKCQVPVVVHGKTEYTTGPCQQAVKDQPELARSWFKNCPHGPDRDEEGNEIPPELRPYYEMNIEKKSIPVVGEQGEIKEWEETQHIRVRLRIQDVALSPNIMGGRAVKVQRVRGGKFPQDFGVAPFCQNYGCQRQDVRRFANGLFCTDNHAAFVYARETGAMIPIGGFDASWPGRTSSRKRGEVMASLKAKVAV